MYDYTFAIGVFGASRAGKRRCLSKLAATALHDTSRATIGVEFYTMSQFIDSVNIKLDVWVFSWEPRFKHLISGYCALQKGFAFLFDLSKHSSLAYIDEWLAICREAIGSIEQVPIALLGNKSDLLRERKISRQQALEIVKSRGLSEYFEVSCKTGRNIENAFKTLARMLVRKHCFNKINR